ncbi:MAG: hypothetical protein KGD61_07850 [Candidatus Lokiarchaeota archaeon]|nr:hypothetical protein [Candidatus Lokiarchaeota archaeon]
MIEKEAWALQLDWLNILSILRLDTIDQIPEIKRERVIKKISKLYELESLLSFKPSELDELVANELRELMKKELIIHARQKEKLARQMKAKMAPFRNQGVMRIDMNQIKDMNPDELMKFFSKQLMGKKDDEDQDDDNDKYSEDKNSYYI